jgi:hypothetical protein
MTAVLPAVRALYGDALLLAPLPALERVAGAAVDRGALAVARLLGARQLVQAAMLGPHPSPGGLLTGAGIDLAHAVSMAAVARWSSRASHRRMAARHARTAGLFAAWGMLAFANTSVFCQTEG